MKNRNIPLYMAFTFLSNFSTILSFLTVYLTFVGFSLTSISGMLLAYQLSKFVLEVPTGYIADVLGRKASGVLGIVGMAVFYLALLVVRDPLPMLAAFVLRGLSVACLSGSLEAIYIDSVPQGSLVKLNVAERLVFHASYALSAYVGGWISVSRAYRFGLVFDIAAMMLALGAAVCMREPQVSGAGKTGSGGASIRKIARFVAGNTVLISAYAMDASQAFAFVALEDYFSMLLGDRGMDSVAAGSTIAIQLFISAAVGFAAPVLLKHVNGKCFIRAAACARLVATAAFLLPVTPSPLLPPFYVLQTILYALFAPVKYAIFQQNVEPAYRCSLLSVQSQMISIGAAAFYLFNTVACRALGIRVTLLVAQVLSLPVYVSALFHLTEGGACS